MTIRVGLIGAGNIGTSHARDLQERVAGSEVSVIYDFDEVRAAELARELDARAVRSYQEVIEADDVDAVLIASPDHFHTEQALACLAARKPTLCEKPLAPTEDEARAVMDAEVALGTRLIMMGFMRRFDPGYLELKDTFGPEGIGDPLIIRNSHRNEIAPYGLDSALSSTTSSRNCAAGGRWCVSTACRPALASTASSPTTGSLPPRPRGTSSVRGIGASPSSATPPRS